MFKINLIMSTEKKECTISPELFEAWKKLKRRNDAQLMVKQFKARRPIIDNALNFGYALDPKLIEKITAFFMNRLKAEKEAADKLLTAAAELPNQ